MSEVLLQRLKTHIIDDGGLLSGYDVRYYKWSDIDLNGSGSVAMFRMAGTSGRVVSHTQFHDVSVELLANPTSVKQADNDMLGVLRYLRSDYFATGVFNAVPMGAYNGPIYLSNGRAMFEMVVRCGTEDH